MAFFWSWITESIWKHKWFAWEKLSFVLIFGRKVAVVPLQSDFCETYSECPCIQGTSPEIPSAEKTSLHYFFINPAELQWRFFFQSTVIPISVMLFARIPLCRKKSFWTVDCDQLDKTCPLNTALPKAWWTCVVRQSLPLPRIFPRNVILLIQEWGNAQIIF